MSLTRMEFYNPLKMESWEQIMESDRQNGEDPDL